MGLIISFLTVAMVVVVLLLGIVIDWTIRNLRTSSNVGSVIDFGEDASNNTFKFLALEAETDAVGIIHFITTTGLTVNDDNTISNIDFDTDKESYPFVGIRMAGSANYTCVASGEANVIGDQSSTGDITVTVNASATTNGFIAIYSGSSGTTSIAYNEIGGITMDGKNSSHRNVMIYFSTGGTVTVDNNLVGGTIANSIYTNVASELFGLWSSNI